METDELNCLLAKKGEKIDDQCEEGSDFYLHVCSICGIRVNARGCSGLKTKYALMHLIFVLKIGII